MQDSGSSPCGKPPRRLILGAAFALGLMAALTPHMPTVLAAGPAIVIVQADTAKESAGAAGKAQGESGARATTPSVPPPSAIPAPPVAGTKPDADTSDADTDEDMSTSDHATIDRRTIVIEKGGKRVRVGVLGRDREYDSFEQFVQDAPWLAGLVFLTVMLVFLVPLLIIVLLIWYKIRKNRMANETMLKLAERGVVPPVTAMDAIASGNAASLAGAATAPAPNTPAYDHARALQRRAVWSDLRKGVILLGAGLGLSAFSMFDDGTANSVGLILLFVGLGYCLLWYLEDRPRSPEQRDPSIRPPAGGAS